MTPPADQWRLEAFLEAVAAATPAPAGGSAGAVTGAFAAALCEMTAGISGSKLAGSAELSSRARELRTVLVSLAEEDAAAFEDLLAARRAVRMNAEEAAARLAGAKEKVVEVPLATARAAVPVAVLASQLAEQALPSLQGDNYTAALLAECSGRIALALVRLNLASEPQDPRLGEAARIEAALAEARGRAAAALNP